jgi:hypothetical protein
MALEPALAFDPITLKSSKTGHHTTTTTHSAATTIPAKRVIIRKYIFNVMVITV